MDIPTYRLLVIIAVASIQCSTETRIRLTGSPNPAEGRVEVFYNNSWGTVCNDFFDPYEGIVVCRELGYTGVLEVITFAQTVYGVADGNTKIWLDDVHCNGNEWSIFECYHRELGHHNCDHSEDVGVRCDISYPDDDEGALRLVGGNSSSGRLEIFHNGTWGTICRLGWRNIEATVVCRQLGFSGGLIDTQSHFGSGAGVIWLGHVQCSGLESRLASCMHPGWFNRSSECSHIIDVGIFCFQLELSSGELPTVTTGIEPSITTTALISISPSSQFNVAMQIPTAVVRTEFSITTAAFSSSASTAQLDATSSPQNDRYKTIIIVVCVMASVIASVIFVFPLFLYLLRRQVISHKENGENNSKLVHLSKLDTT